MKKTFIRFFTISDFIEEEKWLREQHKKGLKLKSFCAPCFFRFEQCENEDVIYKLDFKNACPQNDYKNFYKDYGWEYCGSCMGWNYFRKNANFVQTNNEGEIFSDTESKINMLEQIIKKRFLPLLLVFCFILIPSFFMNVYKSITMLNSSPVYVFYSIFFGLMFIFYVYIFVHCGKKLKQLKKNLD